MDDKRKFERFAIQVPARIEVPAQDGHAVKLELETHDLSAGGTFIKLDHPLPEGSQVKIDIVLSFEELKTEIDPSGSLILSTTGRVVRSEAEGIAIRFDENYEFMGRLDSLYEKFIEKYPSKHLEPMIIRDGRKAESSI
ncbi:MAG: PilZ domain-containing protein [Syntrophaceae bacterium]|nr:PilZ domain-containing protein [Syntrophaceae bacterium]